MPKDIQFPEVEPRYVFERDCLAFSARVDDKPVECLVTLELLMARFGVREPSEQAMRQAYRDHRAAIQDIARTHLENGWIDQESRIFLTTRFTRLSVSFGASVDLWPEVRAVVEDAHRVLLGLIGPNAGEVFVLWDAADDPPGARAIHLSISDPLTRSVVVTHFTLKEAQQPVPFLVGLARVWGDVLRERSRYLILKSG